jgi:nitroreductase
MKLGLTADELLTTTRAVRRRLDFDGPVARETLEHCIEIAIQAPNGGNHQGWHWLLVSEPSRKRAIAELYRRFYRVYREHRIETEPDFEGRLLETADAFAANLERAPFLVVPCIEGPMGRSDEGSSSFLQANTWASIYPAVWSFMLALRERGLATCLTTNHLAYEREIADLLGIPYERVNQACLLAVARAKGTDFRPGPRKGLASILHLEDWSSSGRRNGLSARRADG